ncbi:hypothetical protein [Falsiroseomonas sp. HW251]|uniref:hypothetical protein n=1 Tax=Falsiroseomonas sp. HW251 TaxID=3390998 RepID=UPI003D316A10
MSDSALPRLSIAITPMHRNADGAFESGAREDAAFFLVELVQGDGADAEILLECSNERAAALAARVAAATASALGLGGEEEAGIEAFDEDTAAILDSNPTPEIAMPNGVWSADGEEEDEPDRA